MATAAQREEIIALVVGMFDGVPGANYLNQLVLAYDAGATLPSIAAALATKAPFATMYPPNNTNSEFADRVVENLLGSNVTAAIKTQATDWVLAKANAGETRANIILQATAAIRASTGTDLANAKAELANKVDVATYYSVTKQQSDDNLGDLQAVIANVTSVAATVTTAKAAVDTGAATSSGQTFTLTSGVNFITGTSGNDTVIADNTGTPKQLSVADQIDGGAGTDTLKIYLAAADTATGQPTLTSIEEVYINGGAITAYTAPAGSTKLSIDSIVAGTAATYNVGTKELSLANQTNAAATTTTIVTSGASHTTTLNAVTGAGPNTLAYTAGSLTTLNLATTGAASSIALTNAGAAITTLNMTGTQGLTISAAPNTITTVNAATATGALSYAAGTALAAFKFTGGEGNDTLSFADNGLAALTAGSQLNGGAGTGDKIAISDAALTAGETTRINAATGFEVLGLNAGITLDASTLTSLKSFSIDTANQTITINSMATGSTVSTSVANTGTLTLGTAVGVTDVALNLGGVATGAFTINALVTTGITNVTITANGSAAKTITTLTNSDNSNFVVKGAGGLTMSLSAGTAVGSKIDGSAATGVLTLTGSGIVGSGDIIIGGAAADVLNGGLGADTLTGNGGADTFVFTNGVNTSGAVFGQADVITDFVVGTDKLQFSGADVVSGQQAAVQTAVTALAAGSTDAQIATAMATASTTANGVSFAVYGGNTYVLYEASAVAGDVGIAGADAFIKLTGVTTLPTFATDVIA